MSVTVYYTVEGKNEDVLNMISEVNSDPDSDFEYIPVDDYWGIEDDEYLIHLDDKRVLLCPKDKHKSTAQQRASLSGWVCAPHRLNNESGQHVHAAVNFVAFIYG